MSDHTLWRIDLVTDRRLHESGRLSKYLRQGGLGEVHVLCLRLPTLYRAYGRRCILHISRHELRTFEQAIKQWAILYLVVILAEETGGPTLSGVVLVLVQVGAVDFSLFTSPCTGRAFTGAYPVSDLVPTGGHPVETGPWCATLLTSP